MQRKTSSLFKDPVVDNTQKIVSLIGQSLRKKVDTLQRKQSTTQPRQIDSFDTQSNADILCIPGLPLDSLKVLQQFKVPIGKLRQIGSTESKMEFLTEHMSQHIKD